jgi:hypothetical protein
MPHAGGVGAGGRSIGLVTAASTRRCTAACICRCRAGAISRRSRTRRGHRRERPGAGAPSRSTDIHHQRRRRHTRPGRGAGSRPRSPNLGQPLPRTRAVTISAIVARFGRCRRRYTRPACPGGRSRAACRCPHDPQCPHPKVAHPVPSLPQRLAGTGVSHTRGCRLPSDGHRIPCWPGRTKGPPWRPVRQPCPAIVPPAATTAQGQRPFQPHPGPADPAALRRIRSRPLAWLTVAGLAVSCPW